MTKYCRGVDTMLIRLGKINELKLLWGNSNKVTQEHFIEGILRGSQEFWVIEEEATSTLIGELHIIWDSEDKDEANGINRSYLCSYRINKNFQGIGFGSQLMKRVLQRIEDKGFNEVTIGVDEDAEKLKKIYNSWGFRTYIKKNMLTIITLILKVRLR